VFHERRDILTEARGTLRPKFLAADVGITGANFLVAETGSSVIVTNEGSGDLAQTLPRVHVVVTSIEKVVPTIEDTLALLRVLARSATGQDMTVYKTFSTGGKRVGDLDGPQEYHVVLLDNGRSGMVGTDFQDMLRCIRCAACMNHCPVYGAVGGYAYGSTYPGPMGAVLTPMIVGIENSADLPNASTLMLPSGPERPTSNNLLPDMAIVLLYAGDIVASYEDAFDRLRAAGMMPRNVMLVTGTSRSADIEQTLELGAHGPLRLHVLIIDGEGDGKS
jgi:L-lactate utilization protein LutB